ncbi:saccharopine dehydrogenase (NAD+, L-lysine forming) [Catalinimonas alkaloidigena]|uniref:Saccharopine dehydrogenase (NAD+, L-lysine forming) n=1 Tax=Catalinimonas alkaloidigena TaxID=1075417 RepID=A0A1G9AJA8_9BACT|nr:saccharopine dehydrogenase family protein [Catalinimonas alkaloidigena]SDK27371.1 saccharopine dehydrogenase (NAD+, L-lysine forming) [Catalinimonas alkaloidigena]
MSKVLIIGAGGVGSVVVHKCAAVPEVFSDILLASRTKAKCDKIAASVAERIPNAPPIKTVQVDADNVPELVALIRDFQPKMVINVALPYQDLTIMDACLETGVHYLDTANYEPKDVAKFEYSWQWAYQDRFKEAGLMALLGCGFDPGVTGVFTAYAAKHHFDEIQYLDIVDCNAGDHGKAFATNFNPEINIREITQHGRYWENGAWHETEPLSIHQPVDYPEVGPKESYLLFHEELESLVKNFPSLKRARFWMTFSQNYINHLRVLENVGMTRIDPVRFQGQDIVPLEFLKAVLPEPASLGEGYKGKTSIGCQIKGLKNGQEQTYFIWNNCDHAAVYQEIGAQAVSYTTGVPAMIGAMMMLTGKWMKPGVYNVEEFDPDPFLAVLGTYGLPWHEKVDAELAFAYPDAVAK